MKHKDKKHLARTLLTRSERKGRIKTPLFSGLQWSSRRAHRENPKPRSSKI